VGLVCMAPRQGCLQHAAPLSSRLPSVAAAVGWACLRGGCVPHLNGAELLCSVLLMASCGRPVVGVGRCCWRDARRSGAGLRSGAASHPAQVGVHHAGPSACCSQSPGLEWRPCAVQVHLKGKGCVGTSSRGCRGCRVLPKPAWAWQRSPAAAALEASAHLELNSPTGVVQPGGGAACTEGVGAISCPRRGGGGGRRSPHGKDAVGHVLACTWSSC
jgi:hypothetical protein